jgi:hypothetical protein
MIPGAEKPWKILEKLWQALRLKVSPGFDLFDYWGSNLLKDTIAAVGTFKLRHSHNGLIGNRFTTPDTFIGYFTFIR